MVADAGIYDKAAGGHLEARRRRAMMNQAVHNVDLLLWLMGR